MLENLKRMGSITVPCVQSILTSGAPAQETMWSQNISQLPTATLAMNVIRYFIQRQHSTYTDQLNIQLKI